LAPSLIFGPKWQIVLAIFRKNTAILCQKSDLKIGFEENRQRFAEDVKNI
jgi:hypothetical protein